MGAACGHGRAVRGLHCLAVVPDPQGLADFGGLSSATCLCRSAGGLLLVPPPHIWNVAAVVGAVIGLVAYWIHTSPLDASARKRRKRWFNVAVVAAGILLGRGLNFISDWHLLLMALDDLVSLVVALWLTWTLIGFTDMLARRLDR